MSSWVYTKLPRICFVTKTIPRVYFTKPNITQHRNKIPAFEVVSRVAVVTWPPKGKWRRWSIVFSLHSRLSRAWLWSRDRLKENGGDGVLFLVTTEILGNVCIQDDISGKVTLIPLGIWLSPSRPTDRKSILFIQHRSVVQLRQVAPMAEVADYQ
jgi:hypothetical protein